MSTRTVSTALVLASLALVALPASLGCQGELAVAAKDVGSSAADARSDAPGSGLALPAWSAGQRTPQVPDWAVDAVFYQVFPERFRNGDPANDPTRDSLEAPHSVPESWAVSPWTGDWYARADWEQQLGDNFFEHGVFNRRYGGDLQGVIDKLDYLQDLGVNTIYFNPVFYGRSLHKYDAASMHHIDPYFGPDPAGDLELIAGETSDPDSWHWTAADKLFLELVEQAHDRGIRVIIDGVFNHTGRDFFAFADLRERQSQSPYTDWYIVQTFDDPATDENEFRYKGWWGIDTLPEFADVDGGQDLHPGPKEYIMNITRRWMDPDGDGDPRDGIDGWRLDVANEVPLQFWRDWHGLVRQLNPAAYTVAEIWDDAREFLAEGGFSATMNYHGFSYLAKGFLIDGRLSAHDFGRELLSRAAAYPHAMQFALQNLIGSHDTDRLASMIVNRPDDQPYLQPERFDYDVSPRVSPRHDKTYQVRSPTPEERRLQRMVVLLQMTTVGPPMVYYGDEAGMWGADDPCDRKPMVWDDLQYEPQAADPWGRRRDPDDVQFDDQLHDFYRRAIALRNSHPVLRRGGAHMVDYDDDRQFLALARTSPEATAIVAFNRGSAQHRWELPDELAAGAWRLALATDDDAALDSRNGAAAVVLPPHSALVLLRP